MVYSMWSFVDGKIPIVDFLMLLSCECLYVSNKISTVLKFNSKFNVNMYIVIWTTYNIIYVYVSVCVCVLWHTILSDFRVVFQSPFFFLSFCFLLSLYGLMREMLNFQPLLHQRHPPLFPHNERKSKFYTLLQIYIRGKYTILNLYTA